jgi:glycosyltransferase involved in cell wall biosynthesis
MRILLVSYLFPKAADPRLGVFTLRQAELLRAAGHDIQVICPVPYLPGPLSLLPRWRKYRHPDGPVDVSGFEVHRPSYLRPPGAWFLAYEGQSMWRGMRSTVKRLAADQPFDLVYGWDFRGSAVAGVRAARYLGIPCVGLAIGVDLNLDVRLSGGARRSFTQALMDCDAVACVSQALCKRVEQLTRGQRRGVYITTGADTSHFRPADRETRLALRGELGWPHDAAVLLFVGYLLPAKGVFELVESFNRIAEKHPRALLVLVGEGPAWDELKARIADSPHGDRIRLAGHVHRDRVTDFYRAADVAVLPSHHEGMPNVVLEGMACGLPILGSDVGGIPEAVPDERFGLVVPPQDPERLAEAMDRLLADTALRTSMGRACRERAVKCFDIESNNRRLCDLLEETVRQGRRPPQTPARNLAVMVDLTSNTPPYTEALARSMRNNLEVTCRARPYDNDPRWYDESGLRDDLAIWVVLLGERHPGLREKGLIWDALQFAGYLASWWQVVTEALRRGTRVIHIQWCKVPVFDLWVFVLLRVLGFRIVYTVHDALPHGDRRRTSKWKYRQLYRLAHALVVLSKRVGSDIQEWVLPGVGHKIHHIEHGLLYPKAESPTRAEAREQLGISEDAEMSLFFGGIEAYKGIADMIEAFGIAGRQRPRMVQYIAGLPWEPWEPYQKQIDRLGMTDRVKAYPRFVSEEFKVALYAAADIVMLPHRDPSQSAMGLEALALGKPLIATRAGGLPDLVEHGKTGYLVPVRDPQAMAEAMLAFFEQTSARQQAMAEASRQLGLARFDWNLVGRKHVRLYRSLAGLGETDTADGRIHTSHAVEEHE